MTTDAGWEGSKSISLEEYAAFTPTTFIVPECSQEEYLVHGLAAEVGEFLGHYAKFLRNDFEWRELDKRVRKELGDIMYFVVQYCNIRDWDLGEILQENKAKLEARQKKDTLRGDGDDR